MSNNYQTAKIQLPSLRSPIPAAPPEIAELQKSLTELGLIPYYGENAGIGIAFLDLIRKTGELSPAYNMVVGDLNLMIFGSGANIAANTVPGLIEDSVDQVPMNTQKQIGVKLNEIGLGLNKFSEIGKLLNRQYMDSGNAYLRIKRTTIAGVTRYMLFADHYLNCSYLIPEPGEEDLNLVLVSPYLMDVNKLKETRDFRILQAVFPGDPLIWTKTGNGIEEALIHIKNKNGSDKRTTYGRSEQIPLILPMMTDYYYRLLSGKIAATDLISKKMIVVEAPPPEVDEFDEDDIDEDGTTEAKKDKLSQFDRNVQSLRQITSNLGDADVAASVGLLEIPNGSQMPVGLDLEVNRDKAFQEYSLEIAIRTIFSGNGWSSDLSNITTAPSGIGGNIIIDMLTIKRITKILPSQEFWTTVFNTVINDIAQAEGLEGYGIKFEDKMQKLIDSLKGKNENSQQGQNEGATIQGQQTEVVNQPSV